MGKIGGWKTEKMRPLPNPVKTDRFQMKPDAIFSVIFFIQQLQLLLVIFFHERNLIVQLLEP